MSNSGGKITAPVSIEDVRTVLGVSSYDLGTLCKSEKINMWAKYKPVRYNKMAEITENERAATNYGLQFGIVYTGEGLVNEAKKTNSGWAYLPPRGGSYNEPYRLSDFDKYRTISDTMFMYSNLPSNIPTIGTSTSIELLFRFNSNAELKPKDFYEFSTSDKYRYAVMYYKDNYRDMSVAYGSLVNSVSEGNILINVNFPSLGIWHCFFVATSETESTFTSGERTVLMPKGNFDIRVYREYIYANVSIDDYSSFHPYISKSDGSLLGLTYFNITIKAVNKSFPTTNGLLGINVMCYSNTSGMIGEFDIWDEHNGVFNYAGTDSKSLYIDFMSGSAIRINEYLPDIDVYSIDYAIIEVLVDSMNGSGLFKMEQAYKWRADATI